MYGWEWVCQHRLELVSVGQKCANDLQKPCYKNKCLSDTINLMADIFWGDQHDIKTTWVG